MITKIMVIVSVLTLAINTLLPVTVAAESASSSVLINEVMTASLASNKDEFIELINAGNSDIDLNGWTLEYINGSGNSTKIHSFSADATLAKGGYFLGILSQTPPSQFLNDLSPKFEYSLSGTSGMAYSAGGLVLKDSIGIIIDSVSWVDNASSSDINVVPGMAKEKSIERKVVDGKIANTGVPSTDFMINATPTPSVANDISVIIPPDEESTPPDDSGSSGEDIVGDGAVGSGNTDLDSDNDLPIGSMPDDNVANPNDTPPQESTGTPIASEALTYLPLIINELFIDPQSPLTDADDEYIEIYNPNSIELSLSGYTVIAGNSGSYRHTFDTSDFIEPYGFKVIKSKDTAVALSNSGGKVILNDASGNTVSSVLYDEAKPGESWALNDLGQWQWSTTVTSGSINVITLALPPPVKATAVAIGSSTKKSSATTKPKTTVTTAKAATTKAPKATAVKAAADTKDYSKIVDAPVFVPVWLLALMGCLAVIYLAYEYRFEISNKIYQLRQYRANR